MSTTRHVHDKCGDNENDKHIQTCTCVAFPKGDSRFLSHNRSILAKHFVGIRGFIPLEPSNQEVARGISDAAVLHPSGTGITGSI